MLSGIGQCLFHGKDLLYPGNHCSFTLFGRRFRDRLPAADPLAALVAGQLHDTAVHFHRYDLRDAHFHRLLDDEIHFVGFGKSLKEKDIDGELRFRLFH